MSTHLKMKTKQMLIKELQALRDQLAASQSAETERKQTEKELQAAYAFQQWIIDGVVDPIMVIDKDYQVILMNRAARKLSDSHTYESKPLLCFKISHLRDIPCDGIEHPCPLEQVRNLNKPVTVVHKHYQADGKQRLLEINAAPLYSSDGTFKGIIESMRDITARKQTEEALEKSAKRMRTLAAQLGEVAEGERQRLARQLHDLVGQNLTALGLNLNIIRAQLPGETPMAVLSRLEDSLVLVEETTDKIRHVMANLRPPVLDDYGLVAALHWYREQIGRRTDIPITVYGEEPSPRLAASVENAFFRIAQEALTNVIKHAGASEVTVKVEIEGDLVRLIVADDGLGFDPSEIAEPEDGRGWGLFTMTERAEAVGGHCMIESIPNHGTNVVVEVSR